MQKIVKSIFYRIHDATALPTLLLGLSLVSVFIFQNDRHSFQPGHHGFLSSHGMTISANLSLEHRFLMFNRVLRDETDAVRYELYNRFPIGAFAAIRMFTLPFQHGLSMQISVARNLMNCFFIAAACLAYLIIFRLFADRWVAATATLLAFSSYYCLYYNDMIFNDVPTLFGLLLAFHGMVVFVQDGRFYQLVVKSFAAIFLGWQAYAILLPFTVLGCARELVVHRSVRSVVRSHFFVLGVSSFLFGGAILCLNLLGEYLAIGGPAQDLPTFRMMLWRFGLSAPDAYTQYVEVLAWPMFIKEQLYRIGRMSLPHILFLQTPSPTMLKLLGIVVVTISLLSSAISRRRILFFSLVVSGFCWALPMRHFVTFHDFQSLYFIGVPLFLFSVLCSRAMRSSRVVSIALCCTAAALFALSSLHLNLYKAKGSDTDTNVLTADFQRIRDEVGTQRSIFVDGDYNTIGGARHAVGFYLAGNEFVSSVVDADFVVSRERLDAPTLLTEENQRVFLYKGREWVPTRDDKTRSKASGLSSPNKGIESDK